MMNFSLRAAAAMLAVMCLLSGCQTIGNKMGLSAEEVTSPKGVNLIADAAALNAAMTTNAGVTAAQVAELGYSTVSDSCDVYFTALIKTNNRIQLTKADLTSFGTAAAVISTLTGGTTKVVGGTAALFGLASSITSNFEQYAFATPYPVQTNLLITKALTAYAQAAPPSGMVTIQQAVASVAGYARLCSFTGISVLAQQAIAAGVPVNTAGTSSIYSTSDRTQYLNNVDALLAVPGKSLADAEYVTLAVMADSIVTSDQFVTLQKTLSDSVDKPTRTAKTVSAGPPVVIGPSDFLKQAATYLSLLGTSNPAFAKQVAAAKAALASPAAAAPAAPTAAPVAPAAVPAPLGNMSIPHIQIKS
jgi:hypothetical protein